MSLLNRECGNIICYYVRILTFAIVSHRISLTAGITAMHLLLWMWRGQLTRPPSNLCSGQSCHVQFPAIWKTLGFSFAKHYLQRLCKWGQIQINTKVVYQTHGQGMAEHRICMCASGLGEVYMTKKAHWLLQNMNVHTFLAPLRFPPILRNSNRQQRVVGSFARIK